MGSLGLTDIANARATRMVPFPSDGNALRVSLHLLDAKISIDTHSLTVEFNRALLAEALKLNVPDELLSEPIILITSVLLKRRGIEHRLVYAAPDARPANCDPHLIDLVRRGWAAWKKLSTDQRSTNPVERSHLVRLARLRFLAPEITLAIIAGRQPVELTARSLLRSGALPIDWEGQRKALGFA